MEIQAIGNIVAKKTPNPMKVRCGEPFNASANIRPCEKNKTPNMRTNFIVPFVRFGFTEITKTETMIYIEMVIPRGELIPSCIR